MPTTFATKTNEAALARAGRVAAFAMAATALAACTGRVEPESPPARSVAATEQAAEPDAGPGDVANGQRIYEVNCVFCHGPDGTGGPGGGAPLVNVSDPALVVRTVNDGRGYTMPSFYGVLSDSDIRDVGAYVTQRLAK